VYAPPPPPPQPTWNPQVVQAAPPSPAAPAGKVIHIVRGK
jgi:hypothetical protein